MENLIQSVATSLYIVVLWFPIAVFIVFKIIFMKNNMEWGKTKHGTAKVTTNLVDDAKQNKKEEEKAEELINA